VSEVTFDFGGTTAVVTGGASGIGEACVRMLVQNGARVMIADRAEHAAAALAAELGESAASCHLDVSDPLSADAAMTSTLERFGRLDLAVNSAGVGVPDPVNVGDLSFAEWRRVLSVNLDGVFNSVHSEVSAMLASGGGSIVNVASVMAVVGTRGAAAYVAAKHGVLGLTKAAALEYADAGIRINAVGPGHIQTPMFERHSVEVRAVITAQYPMGRVGTPHEIASFVCFISSAGAGFATGAYFAVDGGYIAQ
jgi:NAD(P)-dependent dehydrogenase (short-subunit alcohol dehydrogenase family)